MKYQDLEHIKNRQNRIKTSVANVDHYINMQLNERFSTLLKQGEISERDLDFFGAKLVDDPDGTTTVSFDHLFDPHIVKTQWNQTFIGQALTATSQERIKFWPTLNEIIDYYDRHWGENNQYLQKAKTVMENVQKSIANQDRLLKRFIKLENPSLFFEDFINNDLGKKIVQASGFALLSVLANGQQPQALTKTFNHYKKLQNNLVGSQKPVFEQWTKQVLQHWLSAKPDNLNENDQQTNFHWYFKTVFAKAKAHNDQINQKLQDHQVHKIQPFSKKEIALLKTATPESAFLYHLKNRFFDQIDDLTLNQKAVLEGYDLDQWANFIMSEQRYFDLFCQNTFLNQSYQEQLEQSTYLTIVNSKISDYHIEMVIEDPQMPDQVAIDGVEQLHLRINNFSIFEDPQQKKWLGWGIKSNQIANLQVLDASASEHFQTLDSNQKVLRIELNPKGFKSVEQAKQWLMEKNISLVKNPNLVQPYDLSDFFATKANLKVGDKLPLVVALERLKTEQTTASTYDFNQAFIKIQNERNHHVINPIQQSLTYLNHPDRQSLWTKSGSSIRVDRSQDHQFLPMAITLATVGNQQHQHQKVFNDPHYDNTVIKALNIHNLLQAQIDFDDPDQNWFKQDQLLPNLEVELATLTEVANATQDPQLLDLLKTQKNLFAKYQNYQQNQSEQIAAGFDFNHYLKQMELSYQNLPEGQAKTDLIRLSQAINDLRAQQKQRLGAKINQDQRYEIINNLFNHHILSLTNSWYAAFNDIERPEFRDQIKVLEDQIAKTDLIWQSQAKISYYQAPIDLWNETMINYRTKNDARKTKQVENEVALAKATIDQNNPLAITNQPVATDFATSLIDADQILKMPNPTGSPRLHDQQLIAKAYLENFNPSEELLYNIYHNQVELNQNWSTLDLATATNVLIDQLANNFNDPHYQNLKSQYYQSQKFTTKQQQFFQTKQQDSQLKQAYSFSFATQKPQWNNINKGSEQLAKNYGSLYQQMVQFWNTHVSVDEVVKIGLQLVLDPKIKHQLNQYQQSKLTGVEYQLKPELINALNQELVRELLMDPYNPHAMQNIINLIQGGSDFDKCYKRDRAGRYVRINPTTLMVANQAIEINVDDPLPEHYSRSQHQEFASRNQKTFARFDHFYQQLQNHQDAGLKQWEEINRRYQHRSLVALGWGQQSSALGLSLVGAALALRSNRNAQLAALLSGPVGVIFIFLAPLLASLLTRGWGALKAKGWQLLKNRKLKQIENKYFLANQLKQATINDLYPHSQNPHLEIDTLSAAALKDQIPTSDFFPWAGANEDQIVDNYDLFKNLETAQAAKTLKSFSHYNDLNKFNLSLKHQNIDLFAILNQSENIVSGFSSTRDQAYQSLNQKLLNNAKAAGSWIEIDQNGKLKIKNQVGFKALPKEVFRNEAMMKKFQSFLEINLDQPLDERSDLSFHQIFKTTICDASGHCQDNMEQLIKLMSAHGFGPPNLEPQTLEQWKVLFSDQNQARALFSQNQPWSFLAAQISYDQDGNPLLDQATTNHLKTLSPEGIRRYLDQNLIFQHEIIAFNGQQNQWDPNHQYHKFFDEKAYYEQGMKDYQALINTLKKIGTPQQLINQISQKYQIFADQATSLHQFEQIVMNCQNSDPKWSGLNIYLQAVAADQSPTERQQLVDHYFNNYLVNEYENQLITIDQQMKKLNLDLANEQEEYLELKDRKQDLLNQYHKQRDWLKQEFLAQFDSHTISQNQQIKKQLFYEHESVVAINQDWQYQSEVENHSMMDDTKMATYAKIAWTDDQIQFNPDHQPSLNPQQDLVLKYLDFISNHEPKIAINQTTWEHFLINEQMFNDSLLNQRKHYLDQDWLKYENYPSDYHYEAKATKQQAVAAKNLDLNDQTIYSENKFGKSSKISAIAQWWRKKVNKWLNVNLLDPKQPSPIDFAFNDDGTVKFDFNQMQTMLINVFAHPKVQRYIQSKPLDNSIHKQNQALWNQFKKQKDYLYEQSQAYQNQSLQKQKTTKIDYEISHNVSDDTLEKVNQEPLERQRGNYEF